MPESRAVDWYWGLLLALLAGQLALIVLLVWRAGSHVPLEYGLATTAAPIVMSVASAVLLRALLRRLRGDSWRWGFRRALSRWTELVLVLAAYLLLAQAYMWGKVFVPGINPVTWDAALSSLDRMMCLGVDPNVALVTIFAGNPPWVAIALDRFYGSFVVMMLATTAWFVTDTSALRRGFLAATAVLWSLGLWLYLAFPAMGPVFTDPQLWRQVADLFPAAAATQLELLKNYGHVMAFLQGSDSPVSPALGIAAMPSLHVAAQALFFLWCRRLRSRWRTVFLSLTMLTFLGAVATGWHWAVDCWVGIILAMIAARVGWAVARFHDPDLPKPGDA